MGEGWTVQGMGMQVGITVMHVGRLGVHSNGFSILAAIQVLLLWLKIQYFAR